MAPMSNSVSYARSLGQRILTFAMCRTSLTGRCESATTSTFCGASTQPAWI